MNQAAKRILSIFLALIIIIFAIIIYSSFVVPAYSDANQLRGELSAKQDALDEQRQISARVRELLQRFLSIPDLEDALANIVPNKEDVSTVFNEIQSIAQLAGVRIDQFNSDATVALQPNREDQSGVRSLGTLQVETTIIGNYGAIKTFVQALERDIRIMEIAEFKIQNFAQPGDDLFSATLNINAHYQS